MGGISGQDNKTIKLYSLHTAEPISTSPWSCPLPTFDDFPRCVTFCPRSTGSIQNINGGGSCTTTTAIGGDLASDTTTTTTTATGGDLASDLNIPELMICAGNKIFRFSC